MPDDSRNFKHLASGEFWKHYQQLPSEIQAIADKNYLLLKQNPRHPSLQFKKIGMMWSVRVGLNHRALSVQVPEGYLWFWIGFHAEYDQILKKS